MRELTMYETDQAGGGALATGVAFAGGLIGQLILEEIGGADGIDEGLSRIYDLFTDSITKPKICSHSIFSESEYCN